MHTMMINSEVYYTYYPVRVHMGDKQVCWVDKENHIDHNYRSLVDQDKHL